MTVELDGEKSNTATISVLIPAKGAEEKVRI